MWKHFLQAWPVGHSPLHPPKASCGTSEGGQSWGWVVQAAGVGGAIYLPLVPF